MGEQSLQADNECYRMPGNYSMSRIIPAMGLLFDNIEMPDLLAGTSAIR